MSRGAKILRAIAVSIAAIVIPIAIGIFVLTRTDWGRERIRLYGLRQLTNQIAGQVRIGQIRGNLFTGATLIDVFIGDSAGRPFLQADTIEMRYSLRSFYAKHLVFRDVRLVHSSISLERLQPGGKWNVERIFPQDTSAHDAVPGFGAWVRFERVTMIDGAVSVREAWQPADSLSGAARQATIDAQLSPDNRRLVLTVPGGYQRLSSFSNINGSFPLIRLADPDSANRLFVVDRLSMTALPFKPPAADVRNVKGTFVVSEDTVWFNSVRAVLPETELEVEGSYAIDGGAVRAHVRSSRLSLADLRFVEPELPAGGGKIDADVTLRPERTHLLAHSIDLRAEGAHVTGNADVMFGDTIRFGNSNLTFANVDTRVVKRFSTALPAQLDGLLSGSLRLAGTAASLDVNGRVAIEQRGGGTSRVFANGKIGTVGSALEMRGLRLRFAPLLLSLVRTFQPDLELGGTINGSTTVTGSTATGVDINGDFAHTQTGIGRSNISARGRIQLAGETAVRNLRLGFAPLQVALIEEFTPDLPLAGTINGRATLTGSMAKGFDVDADVAHEQAGTGRSRVQADGHVLVANGITTARNLKLEFEPLQVALVRKFSEILPLELDGVITGRTTLNGPLQRYVTLSSLDVTHRGSTGISRAIGTAAITFGPNPRVDIRVTTPVLSLATAGLFMPAAGLQGTAHGTIAARGALRDLAVEADYAIDNGGQVSGRGRFDLQSALKTYDFTAQLKAFNANAASTRGPETLLTGTLGAVGSGTDPQTMRATVQADLVDTRLANTGMTADTTRVLLRLADGLATADRAHLRIASATADFSGSFGLVEGRTGELRYTIAVDSLEHFRAFLPVADTTLLPPRPGLQARLIAAARADSLRIARATEVQRAATGQPPEPRLAYDTISPIRRDSIAGSLRAEGVVTGNITRFDARGTAKADYAVIGGNSVARLDATYTVEGVCTPGARLKIDLSADSARVAGFAFDSVTTKLDYTGMRQQGTGTAEIAIFQENNRDYHVQADFKVELDRKELLLNKVAMQLDSITWNSTRPGAVRWAGDGMVIDNIELTSSEGGRLYVNGRVPSTGDADLRLELDHIHLGNIQALLQDTTAVTGVLTLHTDVRGTRTDPRLQGEFALDSATLNRNPLPDLSATFTYANTELRAHVEAKRDTMRLAVADAVLPINLAMTAVTGSRLLERPLSIDLKADSLPLDAMPNINPAVADVRGRLRGNLAIRGTFKAPDVQGDALLDLASVRIVPAGILLDDIAGHLRLAGDSAFIDSLVAHSAGGTITVAGSIDVGNLLRPGFNLSVKTERALALDDEHARIRLNADLRLTGTFDQPLILGTARITEGVIYAPEMNHRRATNLDLPTLANVVDTATISPELLSRPSPFMQNLRMDVLLTVARNTWARNSKGNVEVYTADNDPLHVSVNRASNTITVEGTITAARGEYTYAGRVFELNSGTGTFLGTTEIDPLLHLNGQYAVQRPGREALIIQVTVSGNLRQPTITLASNAQPPLSQSELLTYFAFGQSSSSLLNLEGSGLAGGPGLSALTAIAQQQVAGLAFGALTEQIVAKVQTEGTRAGLDVFRVRTGQLPEEIGFQSYFQNLINGTEIQAGKYLNSRLYLGTQGRPANALPGLHLEYRTAGGLSLESTWEPRYLPIQPTLEERVTASQSRTFGAFLFWTRRF